MLPRRYLLLLLVPTLLVLAGTLGYYVLEPAYTLFDALYMTVTTLTTVGYGEVHPLSQAGRVFTILLLLGGVFTLFYTATEVIRGVVSGEVGSLLGKQRMERNLAELRDHVIICGYGRMGRLVSREFAAQPLPFVVIESHAEALEDFSLVQGIPLHGDATSDDLLKRAGIERARALVTVLASDADNLYITLSARLLNEKLFIVARAEDDRAEAKLMRAGANRVVSPYVLSGFRVAQAVLRPAVVDFIDLAMRTEYLELQIEEIPLAASSRLVGQSLGQSNLHQKLGIIVVAIKKTNGTMIYTPQGDAVLEAGDLVIALGHRQQLDEMEVLAGAAKES